MISPTQIRKPENWQDFEKLCKFLWGEIWNCSDSIVRNGRSGQNQHGVDIYAMPKGEKCYFGIQCKLKDEYTHAKLKKKIVDEEINNARNFRPKLGKLIFATTANKDAEIEQYIREKNIEHLENEDFGIEYKAWEDIVDLLEQHRSTYQWYVNNCQYKDVANINVSFQGNETVTIYPEYVRTIIKTVFEEFTEYDPVLIKLRNLNRKIAQQQKIAIRGEHDYRWQKVYIDIENTGNVTLDDCKLYLYLDMSKVENIDTPYHYINDWRISDVEKAQANARIDNERDVFKIDNGIVYEPIIPLLLKDSMQFHFSIIAKDNVTCIPVVWEFKSRDYTKEGCLKIHVSPQYEEVVEKSSKGQVCNY